MCGRFSLNISSKEIANILRDNYQIDSFNLDVKLPRFNIAPSQEILALINDGNNYRIGLLQWGLIPSFSKDEKIGNMIINARSETISIKPSFKNSFNNKRCIILASSFYEWKIEDNKKIPILIKLKNKQVFSFAGLWSTYIREDQSKIHTCTIITTAANSFLQAIHNRMPVILNKEDEKIWLDPKTNLEKLKTLMKPYNDSEMISYQVSSIVNHSNNDTIECINPK